MTDAIETPMSPETFACVYSTELEHVHVEFCGTHADDGYRTEGYPVRRALDVLERLVRDRDAAIRIAALQEAANAISTVHCGCSCHLRAIDKMIAESKGGGDDRRD